MIPHEQPEDISTELTLLRQRVANLEQEILHIRASNDAMLALFNRLDDGLLLLDHNHTVLAINNVLAAMVGATPATLHGCKWDEVCAACDNHMLSALIQQTHLDGQPHQSREQYTNAHGQQHIFDLQTLLLLPHDNQPGRIILQVTEVTERLQFEALLIQSERRAAAARLITTIAHEVNTPLQAIKSSLYLADRIDSKQQRQRHMTRASDQIDRINHILKRLLNLHDINDTPPAWLNINIVLDRLLDSLQATLQEQRIKVKFDTGANLPLLWGRANDLTQALLNLVLNAIEAMPDGGNLRISTRLVTHPPPSSPDTSAHNGFMPHITVSISDTGVGISPENRSQIFHPFFSTRPEGAGIGLAVSKKVISEHGGHISVDSMPRQGSTFILVLPLSSNGCAASHPDHSE